MYANKFKNSRAPASKMPERPGQSAPNKTSAKKHINRRLCHTSQYKPPGSDVVGLSSSNQPSKRVWEVNYGLTSKKFEELSARHPGIAFVQVGFACHDHPIAHISYQVVWETVMARLQPGWLVADVDGNPTYNEQFNRRQEEAKRDHPIKIDTFCKVQSTKDSVRKKTRWGPAEVDGKIRWEEATLYDMYRNEENRERFSKYDCFLSNHTLYYYTKAEINNLLNINKESVMVCTIHQLKGQSGTINCGEQSYEKDFTSGKVKQTNVDTGEFYSHPDPKPWFEDFCYADENGAIAWTINKGCDDTYIITITSTEPKLVPEDNWLGGRMVFENDEGEKARTSIPLPLDPPPAYAVEEVELCTRDLLPGYSVNKKKVVRVTHPDLYKKLKMFMINKPRNTKTLQDLTAKGHREAGNNTLYGGGKKVDISSEALTEHIAAAWCSGTGLEQEMFTLAAFGSTSVRAVNNNLSGKSMAMTENNIAKQVARFALATTAVVRSKDPTMRVLEVLDDLL